MPPAVPALPSSLAATGSGRPRARGAALVAAGLLAVGVAACTDAPPPPRPSTSSAPTSSPPPSPTPSAGTASTPSAGAVFRDVITSSLSAQTARVSGTVLRAGRVVDVDLVGTAAGEEQSAAVSGRGTGTARVVVLDGRRWLGGDAVFWAARTGNAATGRARADHWLQATSDDVASVLPFTLRSLLTSRYASPGVAALEDDSSPVRVVTLGSVRAWLLGRDGGPRLWVAADGSGDLLRMVVPAGTAACDLRFTGWDRPVDVAAPPADRVLPAGAGG